jgi:ATP-dependent Clp protease adapter protein ClpS
MASTSTVEQTGTDTGQGTGNGDLSQVVVFNDDHHTADYVVVCLMNVFGHPGGLAAKIMLEAHNRGRAIAEVEETELAREHCTDLLEAGLGAIVESV